jgi:hypothetical protein
LKQEKNKEREKKLEVIKTNEVSFELPKLGIVQIVADLCSKTGSGGT